MRPVVLRSAHAQATISPLGATVLSFRAGDGPDLLYQSPAARFEVGRGIRGGVPICWPWFGPHPTRPDAPSHGLLRTRLWQLDAHRDGAAAYARFVLHDDPSTLTWWPHPFAVELEIEVTDALLIRLRHRNPGPDAAPVAGALHTYLAVEDVAATRIHGLSGLRYRDKLAGRDGLQQGLPPLHEPIDRVYHGPPRRLTVQHPGGGVELLHDGATDAVVWNPGERGAARLDDLPSAKGFVCVEAARVEPAPLAPGAFTELSVTLRPLR